MVDTSNSMLALSGLLSSDESNQVASSTGAPKGSKFTPASMVPSRAVASSSSQGNLTDKSTNSNKAASDDDIWAGNEVPTKEEISLAVPRDSSQKRPEYDILYKQQVGAEDVYLGMGDVTPSSTSCTHMVIKVKLPGEMYKDLDLQVKRQSLLLTSPNYHLATYLPRPVDHNEGSAKWDVNSCTLSVTLPWADQ